MTVGVSYIGNASIRLNNMPLFAQELRVLAKEDEGLIRRSWKFKVRLQGIESHEQLTDLLQSRDFRFTINGEDVRVDCKTISTSYSDGNQPTTIYAYELEARELLEGEKATLNGATGFAATLMTEMFPIIMDVATAIAHRGLQAHELRLRSIEAQLGIDNSEAQKRWNEIMDRQAVEGWISQFPSFAEDMPDEFKTEKVREVLAKWQAEHPEEASKREPAESK